MLTSYIKIILYLMKLCIIVVVQANWHGPFTNEGFFTYFINLFLLFSNADS